MRRRAASLAAVVAALAVASLLGVGEAAAVAPLPPISRDQVFGGSSGVASVGEAIPGFNEAAAVGVAPSGRILVAGEDGYAGGAAIVGFRPAGSLDHTYGGGTGYVELPGVTTINSLAVDQAGGAAVLSGRTTLTRVTSAGVVDSAFGSDGTVSLPALGPAFSTLHFWSVAALPGGDLLVAGIRFGSPRMVVLRLSPNGALDPGFGEDGLATVGFGANPNSGALAMVVEPDGKIVLGGYAHHRPALARLLPNGAPDPSFGDRGVSAPAGFAGEATALALALDRDGAILVAGFGGRRGSNSRETLLLRFRSDGSLDRRFGTAARPTPERGGYSTPTAILPSRGHIFTTTVGHGPSIRAYRRNGVEGPWLATVPGVPTDRFEGTAATLDDDSLLFAWTPQHEPSRGQILLERFRVRPARS